MLNKQETTSCSIPKKHVAVSFETPEYTANVDAMGPLRILETIRIPGKELFAEMVWEDLKSAERDESVKKHGYQEFDHHE